MNGAAKPSFTRRSDLYRENSVPGFALDYRFGMAVASASEIPHGTFIPTVPRSALLDRADLWTKDEAGSW